MKRLNCFILLILLFLLAAVTFPAAGENHAKEIERLQKELGIEKISGKTPDFQLISFAGDSIALKNYRGKFLIIHFWATWCKPCRKEMPELIEFYRTLPRKNIRILAISIDKEGKKEAAKKMVHDWQLPFPAAMVTSGKISDAYWTWGIPATYFIGPDGKMVGRILGSAKWKDSRIKMLIRQILKKGDKNGTE